MPQLVSRSQVFECQVSLLHGRSLARLIAEALLDEELHFSRALIGVVLIVDASQRFLRYLSGANLPKHGPKTASKEARTSGLQRASLTTCLHMSPARCKWLDRISC